MTGEGAAAEAAAAEEQLQLQVAAAEEQAGEAGVRAGVNACFSLLNPARKCEDCSSTWSEKSSVACKHTHLDISMTHRIKMLLVRLMLQTHCRQLMKMAEAKRSSSEVVASKCHFAEYLRSMPGLGGTAQKTGIMHCINFIMVPSSKLEAGLGCGSSHLEW